MIILSKEQILQIHTSLIGATGESDGGNKRLMSKTRCFNTGKEQRTWSRITSKRKKDGNIFSQDL